MMPRITQHFTIHGGTMSIQTRTNCRLKIAYCYGLPMSIIGKLSGLTWIKFYDPHTSVDRDTTPEWEPHLQPSSILRATNEAAAAIVVISLNCEEVEWAKYKSNNLVGVDHCDSDW